jgi:hypothetical protein
MKIIEPFPGSEAAVAAGCKCPVPDNYGGRGYLGGLKDDEGETMFIVAGNCPVHVSDAANAQRHHDELLQRNPDMEERITVTVGELTAGDLEAALSPDERN